MNMKPGDVVRLRNVRSYHADPRNWLEFRPDNHKDRASKRVFVCVVLGTEGFELVNKKGEKVMEPLNVEQAMNDLGWYKREEPEE